eukprot:m.65433 g.65433  ORF g.65433 m.65433 type:complete len:95 (-) comp23556_c3_seq1:160-444(-)
MYNHVNVATMANANTTEGEKWDKCLARTVKYTGLGAGFGGLFSIVLLKSPKPMWPVTLGVGIAWGTAIAECQMDFTHNYFHGKFIRKEVESKQE